MGFNDVFADGQSKPGAASIATAATIGSVKTLKNAGKMFFRDTNTIIAELDQYMPSIGFVHTGYNTAILFPVFRGIFQQVVDHLPDLFLVGENRNG